MSHLSIVLTAKDVSESEFLLNEFIILMRAMSEEGTLSRKAAIISYSVEGEIK